MWIRRWIRHVCAALAATCLMVGAGTADAQVQFGMGIALPGVRIGINVPAYPQLMPVPGYPVYYAPGLDLNLFFYDGLYWVFADDQWYQSSWYDGPWYAVEPLMVPDFILRIPIGYYRRPPAYFRGWNREAPPHWGEHWGTRWQHSRRGWDRWNRGAVPPRAPLPRYQRAYPQGRYPDPARQRALENRYYRYVPQDRRDRRQEGIPGRAGPQPYRPPAQRPEWRPAAPRGTAPPPAFRRPEAPQQRAPGVAPGNRFAPQHQRSGPGPQQRERSGPAPQQRERSGPAPQRQRQGTPQRNTHEERARHGERPR